MRITSSLFIPMLLPELGPTCRFLGRKPLRILLIKLLVVVFCQVKGLGRLNPGDDWVREPATRRQLFLGSLCNPALALILNKDYRPVVITTVPWRPSGLFAASRFRPGPRKKRLPDQR